MYPKSTPYKGKAILISTSMVTPYILTKFNSCIINKLFIFTFICDLVEMGSMFKNTQFVTVCHSRGEGGELTYF
jgi:hypothetical protein